MAAVKKILVTGAGGLLGSEFRALSSHFNGKGLEMICLRREELDITDPSLVEKKIEQFKPNYLINCAGHVDMEHAEANPEPAYLVNGKGPAILAHACLNHGIKLVHFSTDFVFDGRKTSPYTESDLTGPINVYGKTKLEGEEIIQATLPEDQLLIFRISWLYGKTRENFIHTLWELSKKQSEVRVVVDQQGSPNPAPLIAQKTLGALEAQGLFHLSCKQSCSRYELIRFLLETLKSPCPVIPVSSKDFPSSVNRPSYSVLGTEKAASIKIEMPSWKEALIHYLNENRDYFRN